MWLWHFKETIFFSCLLLKMSTNRKVLVTMQQIQPAIQLFYESDTDTCPNITCVVCLCLYQDWKKRRCQIDIIWSKIISKDSYDDKDRPKNNAMLDKALNVWYMQENIWDVFLSEPILQKKVIL